MRAKLHDNLKRIVSSRIISFLDIHLTINEILEEEVLQLAGRGLLSKKLTHKN